MFMVQVVVLTGGYMEFDYYADANCELIGEHMLDFNFSLQYMMIMTDYIYRSLIP